MQWKLAQAGLKRIVNIIYTVDKLLLINYQALSKRWEKSCPTPFLCKPFFEDLLGAPLYNGNLSLSFQTTN